MHEARELKNHDATFLAGTLLSIAVHCLTAVVVIQFAGRQPVVISPRTIMVDIGNPPGAAKAPPEPVSPAVRKEEDRPLQERAKARLRERPPVTQPAMPVDRQALPAATPSGSLPVREKPLPLPAYRPEPSAGGELPRTAPPPKGRSEPVVTVHAESAPAAAAYLARIREQIDRNKEYPVAARRGRLQGTVRIRCVLARNGEVISAAIHRPSGSGILDNAAVRAVRDAGPFPELPAGVTGKTLEFDLPIVFSFAETGL